MSAWANVAILTKAKNVKGGLFVRSIKGLPFLLQEGMEVTFVPPVLRLPRSSRITHIAPKNNGVYLVFFEGITNVNQSEQLEGHYCLVKKQDLPQNFDVSPYENLIGVQLLDEQQSVLGEVIRVEENPAHPLLVVSLQGEEVLVPFVSDFIVNWGKSANQLMVHLPEGLIELEQNEE